MSDKVVTKIRIVKCPKCRNLLPEPQGYDVYKCGGCGTDLKGEKSILIFVYTIVLSKFYSVAKLCRK
jgi:DNA-directed RNA polymerase subunit RPC12/RpoP